MKISKSKQELARIISENGGWREMAEFSAQDKDGEVYHYATKPTINAGREVWHHKGCIGEGEFTAETLPNWHQTILSRAEYFHLYPAPDAKPRFCESVMRTIPEPEAKPTIEQLAADYRNAKDFAEHKQQEADAAKADAEAKLEELIAAGSALGLALSVETEGSVITPAHPPIIPGDWSSWHQWEVGDFISWSIVGHAGEFRIIAVHHDPSRNIGDFEVEDKQGGVYRVYGNECRFIRRP